MLPLKTINDLLVVKFNFLFSVPFNASDQHLPLKCCALLVWLLLCCIRSPFLSLLPPVSLTDLSPSFPGLPLTSVLTLSPGYLI